MDNDEDDSSYFTVGDAEITIEDSAWNEIPDLQQHVEKALGGEYLSILLTNDEHIQQLNRDFRDKDKPTNVSPMSPFPTLS